MRPLSRSRSSQSRCSRHATRLCTCSRSTCRVEVAELGLELRAPLRDGGRPDLRGDEALVPPPVERTTQHALGPPVHRRGVDEHRPCREGRLDDGSADVLIGVGEVERLPRPEADDWEVNSGAPESAPLHTVSHHARRRAYSMPPSSPPLASTRGPAGRTSRSHRSSRRARRAPISARVYGFARLVDNLGDEAAGRSRRPSRRARAGARRAASYRNHAPAARDDR